MFARALFAFLALPGIVAFALPLAWAVRSGRTGIVEFWGLVPLAVGVIGLVWCVREFYVSGKGTLAPWSPPEHLVGVGLYQYSRNPMYLSVMLILLGWAACFGSRPLLVYALMVGIAFQLRVVLGEEPWLARKYAAQWDEYRARVPRWFRFRPRARRTL